MQLPKRWLNRALCYVGLFGLVFQITAVVHAFWYQLPFSHFWFLLIAPLLCIASGLIPALQPQKE